MLLFSSLAAAAVAADNGAAGAGGGDAADISDADVVGAVDADNNGRSMLYFEGTSRSMASSAFSTSSGLIRFSTSRILINA